MQRTQLIRSVGVAGGIILCVLNRRVEIYMCRLYLFSDDPVMHRSSPYDHVSMLSDPRGHFFKRSLLSLRSLRT